MAINDIWKLSVAGTCAGVDHVHTLHYRNATLVTDDPTTGQALIDAWQATARTAYRDLFQANDTPVDTITAQKVCGSVPLPAAVIETELAPNRVGAQAAIADSAMAPASAARIITWRTAFSGRRYRGRSYLGGVWDGLTDTPHYITVAAQALMQTYANAAIAVGGADWNLFIFSRVLAALGGNCQNFGAEVTQGAARLYLGTMRSRLLGHGS